MSDGGIFEQRLERAQTEDFVEHFFYEALALHQRHRDLIVGDEPLHRIADLFADAFFAQRLELVGRERINQPAMDSRFDLEPTVGSAAGSWNCSGAHVYSSG